MIRAARPDDADALAALQVRSWWVAYGGFVDHDKIAATAQRVPGIWQDVLASPGDREPGLEAWLDEDARGLTGFVTVGLSRDPDARDGDGELRALYVDPPRLGGGHGHALLRHAEARLAALGHRAATLWVLSDNHPARRFYERHGWTPDDRPGENPYAGWGPSTRYRKPLPPETFGGSQTTVVLDPPNAP